MCKHETFVHNQFSDDPSLSIEERADRHVQRLQGLYFHLGAYVVVNAMLVGINLLTSPDVFWAIWPILGWGVKLAAHALAVFGLWGSDDWKARVRRNYIRRHTGRTSVASDSADRDLTNEVERLRRRVENLETIVTGADWELLSDLNDDLTGEHVPALANETIPK